MPRQPAWRTDEECPSCDAEMVLLGDGGQLALAECQSCGYRETWGTINRQANRGDAA